MRTKLFPVLALLVLAGSLCFAQERTPIYPTDQVDTEIETIDSLAPAPQGGTEDLTGGGTQTPATTTSATDMVSKWDSAGPMKQEVITRKKLNELPEQQAARHAAAVHALEALFPPVPPAGG